MPTSFSLLTEKERHFYLQRMRGLEFYSRKERRKLPPWFRLQSG